MSWFSKITGAGISNTINSTTGLVGTIFGDKAASNRARHDENIATSQQYAAEFQYRGSRNWFDSIIDGLNRIPRPLIAFQVVFSPWAGLYMIFNYPDEWELLTAGLTVLPTGIWIMYSTVIGFFFGGRMQIKSKDFQLDDKSMKSFKTAVSDYQKSSIVEDEAIEDNLSDKNETINLFKDVLNFK